MDQKEKEQEQTQEQTQGEQKSVIQIILDSFCDCAANSAEDQNCINLPNCFFKKS